MTNEFSRYGSDDDNKMKEIGSTCSRTWDTKNKSVPVAITYENDTPPTEKNMTRIHQSQNRFKKK